MFTPRKIASYVFFAFALIALIIGIVESCRANTAYTTYTTTTDVTYSVSKDAIPTDTADYTYSSYYSYNDGTDTWRIIAKTAVKPKVVKDTDLAEAERALDSAKAFNDAKKTLWSKVSTADKSSGSYDTIRPDDTAIAIQEKNLEALKKTEALTNSKAGNNLFWNSQMLLGLSGYAVAFLYSATVGTILFLKKDKE